MEPRINEVFEILKIIEKKIDAIKSVSATRSDDIQDLTTSLAKAQAEMKYADFNKINQYYQSPFSDLAEIVKASRDALAKHGLAVLHITKANQDGHSILHTMLTHSTGQYIESQTRIIPPKTDIQTYNSYVAALKRHEYASITGTVALHEDDDAEIATHQQRKEFEEGKKLNHKYNPKEQSYETITKEQLEEIRYELKSHTDIAEDILEKMKIQSLADMPKSKFLSSINRIREIVQLRDGK